MATTEYERFPLVLPENDGGDSFALYPLRASLYLEFAERFRRRGRAIAWPIYGARLWGRLEYPARLRVGDASAYNAALWYRDAEPLDLSAYAQLSSSRLPHPYWKWRIGVEPKGIAGALYEIDNPSSPGAGASIMAEGLFTKEGELVGLPSPFEAPQKYFNYRGNLQVGYTTDNGSTIVWPDFVWN